MSAALVVPAAVMAHPLGNFTINHYAGLRVEPDRIVMDLVIDQAEIPTFEARFDFDADSDGELSDAEIEDGRIGACESLLPDLRLHVDEQPIALKLHEAGLTFPPGAGGLSTMRIVCGLEGALPATLRADTPATVSFVDDSSRDRLGWREIVIEGSGVAISPLEGEVRTESLSDRLTAYPADLLASGLDDRQLLVRAMLGGPILPALVIPDAEPVPGAVVVDASPAPSAAAVASPAPAGDAVPGGVTGGELPSIFREADLTPFVLLLSLITAAGLGAGHALTPGHGKTLMAAYLVGTRGTPVHALGLGLSVSLSHTVGILVLAAIVVGAADVLPPDLVVRAAPVVAAISIVGIGGWMLLAEVRRRRAAAAAEHGHGHDHPHDHDHVPASEHEHEHSHGGVRHSHAPARGSAITWRSLFVLGLAGGLIPSTSALLILLGSIAAGRAGFGFVLVVAFGLGMAAVMAGIGLAMVFARARLDRLPTGTGFGRVREFVPLAAAVLVFGLGLYLTVQAIGAAPTL
jgi:ABC-type nickel/cobalt efflux system permease component RcnA